MFFTLTETTGKGPSQRVSIPFSLTSTCTPAEAALRRGSTDRVKCMCAEAGCLGCQFTASFLAMRPEASYIIFLECSDLIYKLRFMTALPEKDAM
jgi:hypothetical protein